MFIDLGAEFDLQAATFVAPVTLAVLPPVFANQTTGQRMMVNRFDAQEVAHSTLRKPIRGR
jgi:hypothetical protein